LIVVSPGTALRIDGVPMAVDGRVLRLAAGTHEVTIELPGGDVYEQHVTIMPGQRLTINLGAGGKL
jgi:hypothetical protein